MAEITEQVMGIVEKTKWPEDVKQDFYLHWLESDEELPELVNEHQTRAYINTYLNNMNKNTKKVESNRARLRFENHDEIIKNLGLLNEPDDPQYEAEVDEDIVIKLNGLSAVLRDTLIQYYVEGRSPEAIAALGNENVEAVRKRITRARNQLKENN